MNKEKENSLYCLVRQEAVAALPEEMVRQRLLRHMFEDKGFPKSLVAIEKALRLMPHLSGVNPLKIPDRRADVICYAKGPCTESDLYPLLLVECKAVKLTSRVVNQVAGYNQYVKACFIAIVNEEEIRTGWFDSKKSAYVFIQHLPSYQELIAAMAR